MTAQKSLRQGMAILQDKLGTIALSFDFLNESLSNKEPFKYEFYEKDDSTTGKTRNDSSSNSTPAATPAPSIPATPMRHPTGSSSSSVAREFSKKKQGQRVIEIPFADLESTTAESIIQEHQIPQEHQYALKHKLYLKRLVDKKQKDLATVIWAYAMASYLLFLGDEELYSKVLIYNPNFIEMVAQFLKPESETDATIQTGCLYVLESLMKFKSKTQDMVTALQVSVGHGLFMQLLKTCIAKLGDENLSADQVPPQEYVDALFALLNPLMTIQTSGAMLITAGLVKVLTNALSIKQTEQYRNVLKCIHALDHLVYAFEPALNAFMHNNGVDTTVERIDEEIALCEASYLMRMETSESTVEEFQQERTILLRGLLKLALHLMQSAGSAERMRNLIDSKLPQSIGYIFSHACEYTAGVYGIGIPSFTFFLSFLICNSC